MREARIHIPDAEFEQVGLGSFVSLVREAGLRDVTELVCESGGCLLAVTVDDPVPADPLSAVDRLEWWERLATDDDSVVYLCKLTFPSADDAAAMHGAEVAGDELHVGDTGLDVDVVGTQDAIAREIREYDEAGMSVLLERIGDYHGPSRALDALTDRQREILDAAHDLGYFDVPRSASTADVAEALGLESSTVAEHLQRAERNLVSTLLATP